MGSSFSQVRLADVCEKIGSGATPRGGSEVYQSSGVSLIRSQNVYNDGFRKEGLAYISDKHAQELENVIVQAGDVLLNITGDSVARICQAPKDVLPARVNQHVAIIRPKEDILNSRYLRYFLVSPSMQQYMHALAAAGATRQALTKGMIEAFDVPTPLLPEQKAIASILGALDDKIELNRKMNETLEAMAGAIFKSWFVDFDPIPGLGPHKEWQDSPLGKIPKEWRVGTLGDLVDFVNERVEATSKKDNERYIALDDMPNRSINLEKFRHGAEVNSSIIRFKEGDILFGAMRPYFHKVGLAQFDGITRTTTFVLGPKPKDARMFTLMSFFRDDVIEYATNASVGSTIPYVRWDALSIYQIVIPDVELMAKFNLSVEPLIHQIKINAKQSRTLAAIRDTLLPKLMSGEMRVWLGGK